MCDSETFEDCSSLAAHLKPSKLCTVTVLTRRI